MGRTVTAHANGPLVSASWLQQRLFGPGLRIIDCRHRFDDPSYGERSYVSAHIPGAVHFGLQTHLIGTAGEGRSPLPSGAEFARTAGRVGIGGDDVVVCYDDGLGGVAARAWWLFRHFGHAKVYVLRDGFSSWIYPGESGPPAKAVPAEFPLRASLVSTVASVDVLACLSAKDAAIIDARAPARFRGEAAPLDAIEGHIPGALNIPADRLAENPLLRRCAADAGRLIAYCGSGIIACNIVLACAALGRDDAELYAGSWSDWAARRLPAQSGDGEPHSIS